MLAALRVIATSVAISLSATNMAQFLGSKECWTANPRKRNVYGVDNSWLDNNWYLDFTTADASKKEQHQTQKAPGCKVQETWVGEPRPFYIPSNS